MKDKFTIEEFFEIIRDNLPEFKKILNDKRSVDEVKKVCEHNWEYDTMRFDLHCKKCDMRKPTGANF